MTSVDTLDTPTRITKSHAEAARPSAPAVARECLTLRLGAEEYAIDILRVQEIRGYETPTRLANAPHGVKGILNLRGVIVPVVDLRMKFGLDEVHYGDLTVTVVLNVAGRTVGVVVDGVSDVVDLSPEQIKAAPEFASVDVNCVVGIAALRQDEHERLLILLDIERLLAGADMGLVHDELH